MTQPAKGQEPSMEEILASIRRIIADDDPGKIPPKAAEPPRPVAVPRMAPPPLPEPEIKEDEIDTMLAQLQATSQPEPPVEEEPASDILELTEQMATPLPAAPPAFRTISGQSDLMFEDNPIEPPPPPPPPPRIEEPRPVMNGSDRSLISASTSAAVDSAFNTLAQTVLVQNGRTLEDLVREMLRPMLKTWLDDNLPSMVERLVRAEIERVSRGRA